MNSDVFPAIAGFHDAENVVQQVAQEAARRFEQYDSGRPFVGWVLWIAKSRVIDVYRWKKRDRLLLSEDLLDRLTQAVAERSTGRSHRREAKRNENRKKWLHENWTTDWLDVGVPAGCRANGRGWRAAQYPVYHHRRSGAEGVQLSARRT